MMMQINSTNKTIFFKKHSHLETALIYFLLVLDERGLGAFTVSLKAKKVNKQETTDSITRTQCKL